jgi:hypothetical protein
MAKPTGKGKQPLTPSVEDSSHGDSADEMARSMAVDDGAGVADPAPTTEDDPDWLSMARDAYENSTRFLESSLRAQWERNERAFQSRHPSGSKYYSDQYKGRSRLFRPKTRTSIRQGDAALAAAMFANEDVLSVTAHDDNDKQQQASAEINKQLLQYRLTKPNSKIGIPWFLTCIGAGQNAQKYGVVISKQWWEYEEREDTVLVPVIDETGQPVIDEEGRPSMREETEVTVVTDRPHIDLIEPENLRIDRGADWTDPINSSPFVILLTPMYIFEVEARMGRPNKKTGEPEWKTVPRSNLKSAASRQMWDSTRIQREGNREDSKESDIEIDEYSIVWVHENFMRWGGRDWVYYTAGTQEILSDPVPIEEIYQHCADGDRPIKMGYSILETHKLYPSGKPQLTEGLQTEANEIVNLRLDNVKLALNKRYTVKRGRQVDLKSLLRNVSGSVTLVSDHDDVEVIETKDVTSSSYREQDRINADFDDISGGFSPSSVQTNRSMNETVGGMEMISNAGNMLQDLDLRTFIETWAEGVLAQTVKMIQVYETDETIIALAGKKAQLYQRFGINTVTDDLLQQELTVRINVGIGATNPREKVEKFVGAAKAITEMFGPQIMMMANAEEFIKEIFGSLGYRDGQRFFNFQGQDPKVKMLMNMLQEMQKEKERRQLEADTKIKVAQTGAEAKIMSQELESETELQVQTMRSEEAHDVEASRARTTADAESVRAQTNMWLEQLRSMTQRNVESMKARNAGPAKPAG